MVPIETISIAVATNDHMNQVKKLQEDISMPSTLIITIVSQFEKKLEKIDSHWASLVSSGDPRCSHMLAIDIVDYIIILPTHFHIKLPTTF